jgi:hypothetical protein
MSSVSILAIILLSGRLSTATYAVECNRLFLFVLAESIWHFFVSTDFGLISQKYPSFYYLLCWNFCSVPTIKKHNTGLNVLSDLWVGLEVTQWEMTRCGRWQSDKDGVNHHICYTVFPTSTRKVLSIWCRLYSDDS